MRVYEVRVEEVSFDWGMHQGYKHIAFCINEEKANEVAKAWAEKNEVNQWWCGYGKNKEGHINVEVIDRGEIVE